MSRQFPRAITLLRVCVPVLFCCLVIGCGGGGTYRVSGKVTFNGKAVPAGMVYILPDGSKGNTGASGFAKITDGYYDTGATGGSGAVGGPVIFAVEGIDPNAAPDKASPDVTTKLLFARYEMKVELPQSSSTKDLDIPAAAAKGPVSTKRDAGTIVP